jgi:adenosylmethionine-8-amino-7-oxononanoate aminotransferase
MRELPFYTNWSYAHPRAIELAHELASLAPGDLNRVFFVSGGSEAVESAWKLARQHHLAKGEQAHDGYRPESSGASAHGGCASLMFRVPLLSSTDSKVCCAPSPRLRRCSVGGQPWEA